MNNNKDQLLDYRDPITQEDIDNVPYMRECVEVITSLQQQYEKATTPDRKKKLKTAIIET
jgi:hypothetical protein